MTKAVQEVVESDKRKEVLLQKTLTYQRLFATEDGEEVIADLMDLCGFIRCSMADSPYETAFNEGKRSVIVRILNHINADPEKIVKILKGNRKE